MAYVYETHYQVTFWFQREVAVTSLWMMLLEFGSVSNCNASSYTEDFIQKFSFEFFYLSSSYKELVKMRFSHNKPCPSGTFSSEQHSAVN